MHKKIRGRGYSGIGTNLKKETGDNMEIQKSGIEPNLRIQNFSKKISDLYIWNKLLKINKLASKVPCRTFSKPGFFL